MASNLGKVINELYTAVESFVQRAFDAANARIDAVEKRIAEIPAGPKGEPGEKGERGERGEKGEGGIIGPPGRDGTDGKDGAPGERGEKGEPGDRGENGDPGVDGKDGSPGERGEKGEKGEKGEPGIDGKDGADGLNGKDGAPGERGEKGEKGDPGIDGKDGAPGKRGEKGEPGRDGRDASDLEVLGKMIDERIAETVAALLVEMKMETLNGGRILAIEIGGRRRELKTESQIYRNVYRPETTYERGDQVTFGGSIWHCNKDGAGKPGVDLEGWTLSVKKGRDGKDRA